jgi:uncharacterized protein (DUF1330 family)
MVDDRPWFLTVKLPPAPSNAAMLAALQAAVASERGTVVALALPEAVQPLETGTVHTALLIARFAFEDDLMRGWAHCPMVPDGAQVLACPGLPYEGWPGHFVPTIATVMVPEGGGPRGYMLVEGTGTDQDRMDSYRDIILPMLRERGGYYTVFELGGTVRVLAGDWAEGIFAISRWPDIAAARDFWFCDRYQNVAIPTRTGAGRFDVQITEGIQG